MSSALKQVIHYLDTNSVEATWVDSEGNVVRCHSYSDRQMDMLATDLGDDVVQYADLIAGVEGNQHPITPETPEQMIAQYEAALDAHLDAVANLHRYDNRFTFSIRAGYAGPYQAEGAAFAMWMDTCNAQSYALLQSVLSGNAQMPTIESFISGLPEFVKP